MDSRKEKDSEFLLEGKYFNYISNVFSSVANYYNYQFIRKPLSNSEIDVVKNNKLSKLSYFTADVFGIEVFGSKSPTTCAEIISFAYRTIEAMGIDELILKIRSIDDNRKEKTRFEKVLEYLRYLDVDYEIDSSLNTNDNNMNIIFQLACELDNTTVTLINGNIGTHSMKWTANTDEIINMLNEINKDKEIYDTMDVYVIAKTEEEKLVAVKLVQDLRWCDIKVEMDTLDREKDLQFIEANQLGARQLVILNNSDLNKGLITIKDNLTKEEVKVDEIEVIDYIISNL